MAQVPTLDIPSTPAHSPPASFTTLPDELLDAVIQRLPSRCIIPALNRRLLPFNRAQRFKVLDFWISEARHYRLNRCLRLNPALGAFIQELRIGIPADKLSGPPPLKDYGKKGKGKGRAKVEREKAFQKLTSKEQELNYLLAVTTNLRHLEIYGSVEFIDTFLPGTGFFTRIPSLNRLVLDSRQRRYFRPDDFDDDEEEVYFDPFDLSGLREIYGEPLSTFNHFNNQEYMVDMHRHASFRDSSTSHMSPYDIRLFACNNRKEPFLRLLSTLSLSCIQFVHFGKGSDLIGLLEAIPNPQSLWSLSLFALDNEQQFETLLASFSNLTSLSFGRDACINTDLFYDVVSRLPLQHLHFGPETRVESERILEYVSEGPKKISQLATLRLDNIDAGMAPLRRDWDTYEKVRRFEDWVRPRWDDISSTFTKEAAESLKIAATAAGVRVEGTTFYGLEITETEEYKEDKAEHDRRLERETRENYSWRRRWW